MNSSRPGALEEVVIDTDRPHSIVRFGWADLNLQDRALLQRLVTVLPGSSAHRLKVRRNDSHRIGRVRIHDTVITVPPPMPSRDFTTFFLYASGGDLRAFIERRPAPTEPPATDSGDSFLILLAYLMVRSTRQILSTHIARSYEEVLDRLHTIRGKPIWWRDFGRHPLEGVSCRYREIDSDNLHNRLILAGLLAAGRILAGSQWAAECQAEIFVWRTLASESFPALSDFALAEQRSNRLTSHYVPSLLLAKALIFGYGPDDLFRQGLGSQQGLEFSLPTLFEQFVARLLSDASSGTDLRFAIQESDRSALLDGLDRPYRTVRPDIVVLRGGNPLAVLDAKFKPRYAVAAADDRQGRVTNADIYQLLFYQSKWTSAAKQTVPVPSAIIAPVLGSEDVVKDSADRIVIWRPQSGAAHPYGFRVVPLPMPAVLEVLRRGGTAQEALDEAPELASFVNGLTPRTGGAGSPQ